MGIFKFILYGKYLYSIWNKYFYIGIYFFVYNCFIVIINLKVVIFNMLNDKLYKIEYCVIFNVSLIYFLYIFVIG